jgi:RNA recognition motif-containing protein
MCFSFFRLILLSLKILSGGDFKGVGFAEFWNTEACEKAATLNGKNLLGRPIRIDWTD